MKKLKVYLGAMFIALSVFAISCSGGDSNTDTSTENTDTSKQGKEYTSAYICPMHCEGSGSEKMGQCPVCGMDYVKNDNQ